MLNRFKDFKHEWELQYLGNKDIIFRNTYQDIEYVLRTLSDAGNRFEFECYDTAHLYNLNYFLEQGLVKPPLFVQTVFGLQGGIGAHPDDVMHMKRTATACSVTSTSGRVLGAGRNQLPIAAMAAAMGAANIRDGLEDSLWAAPAALARIQRRAGRLAPQDQRGLGLEVANPRTEARPRSCTSRAATRCRSDAAGRLHSLPARSICPPRRRASAARGPRGWADVTAEVMRIGTRKSAMALAQTAEIARRLRAASPRWRGDRHLRYPRRHLPDRQAVDARRQGRRLRGGNSAAPCWRATARGVAFAQGHAGHRGTPAS